MARYSAWSCETKYQAESGGQGEAAESADGEGKGDEDARDQFHFAAPAAQAVDEHTPAELGDGDELG